MSGSSQSQDTECPVCGKCVSIQGRNGVFGKAYVSKITSCCSKVNVIHYKCAESYSKVFNPGYVFDSSTYSSDTEVQMLCHDHMTTCFNCDKFHSKDNNVSVTVCKQCKMAWCYSLTKSGRRKQSCEETFIEKKSKTIL